jgi:hypothetical protein
MTQRNRRGMTIPLLAWYNRADKERAFVILKIRRCNGWYRK